MKITLAGALAGVLLMAGQAAYAAPITTLYNTGVAADGSVLPHGTVGDPHYTIVDAPPDTAQGIRIITSAGGFPIGPWLGDGPMSRWIGPNATQLNGPVGNYVYRTTFTLNGLNPDTALISGRWSADNSGFGIRLNGTTFGFSVPGFGGWASFQLSTGFVAGDNVLEFLVNNGGGPTGLRVEMNGTADVARDPDPDPTPEPASLAILGAGLAGYAMRRRARR